MATEDSTANKYIAFKLHNEEYTEKAQRLTLSRIILLGQAGLSFANLISQNGGQTSNCKIMTRGKKETAQMDRKCLIKYTECVARKNRTHQYGRKIIKNKLMI